jgi:hypothetical protein
LPVTLDRLTEPRLSGQGNENAALEARRAHDVRQSKVPPFPTVAFAVCVWAPACQGEMAQIECAWSEPVRVGPPAHRVRLARGDERFVVVGTSRAESTPNDIASVFAVDLQGGPPIPPVPAPSSVTIVHGVIDRAGTLSVLWAVPAARARMAAPSAPPGGGGGS